MDNLNLFFDRLQEQPLSIIVGNLNLSGAGVNMPGVSTVTSIVSPMNKGSNLVVIRGILQSYQYPKKVDYRLIKTFGGDNYLYFFGEEVPMLRLIVEFTDGTIFTSSKGWKGWQQDLESYETLNVLDHIKSPNKFFYGSNPSPSENVQATFVFNRVVFNGFILEMDVMGVVNKKGTLTTSIGAIISKHYIINVNTKYKNEAALISSQSGVYKVPGIDAVMVNSIDSTLNRANSIILDKM